MPATRSNPADNGINWEGDGYDHTAPWACSKPDCERCAAKPTYHAYHTARMKRGG